MQVFWLEQTEADVPADDNWLSAGEAAGLAALRFPKRRADWRLGRWTAKRAVQNPDAEIYAAPDGAPRVFIAGEVAPVTISLSHRAGRAVCAVVYGHVALGCDLELVEPRSDAFVADYFTAEEQAVITAAGPARPLWTTLLWSAKESALKALRVGLRADTRSVEVTAAPPAGLDMWRPLHVRTEAGEVLQGCWRHAGGLVRTLIAGAQDDERISSTCSPPYEEIKLVETDAI